jgi:hypothetical protein
MPDHESRFLNTAATDWHGSSMRLGEALQRRPRDARTPTSWEEAVQSIASIAVYLHCGGAQVDQSKAQETNHAMPYLVLRTT